MTYPRFRQIASESPGLIFELATQKLAKVGAAHRGEQRHDLVSRRVHQLRVVVENREGILGQVELHSGGILDRGHAGYGEVHHGGVRFHRRPTIACFAELAIGR